MTLVDALRRLAALQGFVLPADAADTIGEVGSFPLDRAAEVWPTLFPEGTVEQAVAADLPSERLPALIQLEDGRIAVMTRRTVAGALVDLGLPQDSELSELELTALKAIVLHPFPQTHTVQDQQPKVTARQLIWGAIRRRWRIFAVWTLASFVANVLALVASLFAMQGYDRFVPHVPYESAYSTLWVLASGVLFAAPSSSSCCGTCARASRTSPSSEAYRRSHLSETQTWIETVEVSFRTVSQCHKHCHCEEGELSDSPDEAIFPMADTNGI